MDKVKSAEEVFDRIAVKAVRIVSNRTLYGSLAAYDGIEAAREIREMMLAAHERLCKQHPTTHKGGD